MKFDVDMLLAQTSTTKLALIEELACEYSRYLIAEEVQAKDLEYGKS